MMDNTTSPDEALPAEKPPPEAPLISIFPKWLVILMAVASFVAPAVIVCLLTTQDQVLAGMQTGVGRAIFAVAISLYLALFFFVLYPQQIALSKIPGVGVPVRLVGPVVLWIVLVLLLLNVVLPTPPEGRLFEPRYNGEEIDIRFGSIELKGRENSSAPSYLKVPKNENDRELQGVYIRFESDQASCKAVVEVTGREDNEVTFQRGGGVGVFEIGGTINPNE
jgi:hypothetical protein